MKISKFSMGLWRISNGQCLTNLWQNVVMFIWNTTVFNYYIFITAEPSIIMLCNITSVLLTCPRIVAVSAVIINTPVFSYISSFHGMRIIHLKTVWQTDYLPTLNHISTLDMTWTKPLQHDMTETPA